MSSDNRQPTATPGDYTARTRQERLEGLVEHLAIGSCEGDAVLAGDLGALIDEKPAGCSTCNRIATFLDKQNPDTAVVSVSAIRGFLAGEDCGEKGAEEDALVASQQDVARLKDELAKSTQAEVEATNACRVLEADAMRCSRSAEQAKADVERLKGELAYLSDDCPPGECAVLEKAKAEVAQLKEELESSQKARDEWMFKRLGKANNQIKLIDAKATILAKERIDELKAKERQLRDALQAIYEWSFQYVIPKTIKAQVCVAISGQPAVCPSCCELNEAVAQLKEELEAFRKARVDLSVGLESAFLHVEEIEQDRDKWKIKYEVEREISDELREGHKEAREKTERELHAVNHAYDLLLETTVELHRRHSTHIGDTFPGFVERLADERDNLAARLRAMDESTASCAAVQVMAHVVCPVHMLLRAEKAPPCPTCGHVRAECTTIQEDEPPLFYQGIGAMRFARHLLSILDEKAKDGEQR